MSIVISGSVKKQASQSMENQSVNIISPQPLLLFLPEVFLLEVLTYDQYL